MTVTVNVTLENPGTFIYTAKSPLISRLTDGGEFEVGNSSVSVGVPSMVPSGGDIQYELHVERNVTVAVIPISTTCQSGADPCMLGKYTLIQTLDSYSFTAVTQISTGLLAAGNSSLVLLQEAAGQWQVTASHPLPESDCSILQRLAPSDLVVAFCAQGSEFYLAVLNFTSLPNTPLYHIDFPIDFITASYNTELSTWLAYASDGFDVIVLEVVATTEGQYKLQVLTYVNSVTLGLIEMYPAALAAANESLIYLGDLESNIHVLSINASGVVSLLESHSVGNTVALRLSLDGTRLFALLDSSAMLVLDTATFAVKREVPPLSSSSESVTITNELVLSEHEDWLAFPIYNGMYYTVRVLDLTPFNAHSEVFTSLGAGPLGLGGLLLGSLVLASEDLWSFQFAVLQYFSDYSTPLNFYRVLVAPNVTFYPSELHSEVMQLRAYNLYSELWCDPFTVNYL